jgi:hypothetical protein
MAAKDRQHGDYAALKEGVTLRDGSKVQWYGAKRTRTLKVYEKKWIGFESNLTLENYRNVLTGKKIQYGGVVWKVLQDHTSQEGWEPGAAPSLFAEVLIPDPDVIPEWKQPDSTNPYMSGDKVTHNGSTWVSNIDNNVWEPGVYGWDPA